MEEVCKDLYIVVVCVFFFKDVDTVARFLFGVIRAMHAPSVPATIILKHLHLFRSGYKSSAVYKSCTTYKSSAAYCSYQVWGKCHDGIDQSMYVRHVSYFS